MKEPVDHILRPLLPWRSGDEQRITECGLNASKAQTITRDDFHARVKSLGRQRTAMLTCMTCSETVRRWSTWEDDPRLALGREIEWEAGSAYWRARNDRGERLKDELLVIAALVDAHRGEFEAMLTEKAKRREWIARKAALKGTPND